MFFYYSHRKGYHRQLCADFQTGTFKTVSDKGELFLNDVQSGTLHLLFPKNSTKRYIWNFRQYYYKIKVCIFCLTGIEQPLFSIDFLFMLKNGGSA